MEKTELLGVVWVLGCQEPQKANDRFEIRTFEIGYIRNLVKIRKLILFGPKLPKFGHLGSKLGKQMKDLKSVPSKYCTDKISLKEQKVGAFWPKNS